MRCFYRVDFDGEFLEGEVDTIGSHTAFHSRNKDGSIRHELVLRRAEVSFHGSMMGVCGYLDVEKGLFKLVGVEVVFHKAQVPKRRKDE